MDQNTREHSNTYGRIEQFNSDHSVALALITEYADEKTGFDAHLVLFRGGITKLDEDTSGLGTTKSALKTAMADTVIKFCKRGRVKARQGGNTDLAKSLNHPVTYITTASDTESVTLAKGLVTIMDANSAVLTNIVAGDITTMTNAIKAFNDDTAKPVTAKEKKKSDGSEVIAREIPLIDEYVGGMLDLLESYESDLAEEFRLISQIILVGRRHNHLLVHAKVGVSDVDLMAVTCTCDGKTKMTDEHGSADLVGVHTGARIMSAACPGYVTQDSIPVSVKRGHVNEVTVRMYPV